jgi:hypothetical protein
LGNVPETFVTYSNVPNNSPGTIIFLSKNTRGERCLFGTGQLLNFTKFEVTAWLIIDLNDCAQVTICEELFIRVDYYLERKYYYKYWMMCAGGLLFGTGLLLIIENLLGGDYYLAVCALSRLPDARDK